MATGTNLFIQVVARAFRMGKSNTSNNIDDTSKDESDLLVLGSDGHLLADKRKMLA